MHYNLVVKLLSDRYGVQVRGGCACAGTYGHFLLDVTYDHSHRITEMINRGDLSEKPGWVRLSLHPAMTDSELDTVITALKEITGWCQRGAGIMITTDGQTNTGTGMTRQQQAESRSMVQTSKLRV